MNNKRAMYMLAVFCFLFLTLIGYMTYSEVKYSKKVNKSPDNPRIIVKNKTVVRGSVYDRNGVELAYSEKVEGQFERMYPYNNLYSHVIGYVNKDYTRSAMLESVYNTELLGYTEDDDLTKIVNSLKNDEIRGKDLYLTIDHDLQEAANEAIGEYDGAVVALDVKTGEVLAMISKPDFNPNEDISVLKNGELFPRATSGLYPPGSTFKIVTTASIIDNGLEEETYYDSNGQYLLEKNDGSNFVCKNTEGEITYYHTDLEKAFTVSSNVYFAYLSTKLGIDELRNTAEDFMFNKEIDFDLFLEESKFSKNNLIDVPKYNSFIGQGETLSTPFHLALIGASIANGGIMPKPYLVSEIKSGSKVTSSTTPSDLGRVIPEDTANQIKDYMRNVVESGTGTAAAIPDIEVCGKTGTSTQDAVSDGKKITLNNAVFVGFAPYDDPEIAVCALIENGGSGGKVAAPIVKAVMEKYFETK